MGDDERLYGEEGSLKGKEVPGEEAPAGVGRRGWWRREYGYILIFLAAVLATVALIRYGERVRDFENYGYVGIFLMGVIGSASPLWPMPGSWAAFIAGGLGWNPFLVALAAGLGEPIGETVGYMAGYGGRIAFTRWRLYARVEGWMRRRAGLAGLAIFLVCAVPNNVTKLVVAAAGALRFPLWKFFGLAWAGKTLKSLGFAFAGAGLFTLLVDLFRRLFG